MKSGATAEQEGKKPSRSTGQPSPRPLQKSIREYARGIAGGVLFSLPLLYTMEMWEIGATSHPIRLLLYVVLVFLLLLGYNRFAGMRADSSFTEVVLDSIEEIGIGLVVAIVALWILGLIDAESGFNEAMGKIILEAMTVAIGVSVGSSQLGVKEEEDAGMEGEDGGQLNLKNSGRQALLGLCGATLFAANIAPTEETLLIAIGMSSWMLLGLVCVSIAFGIVILYFSEFTGSERFVHSDGLRTVIGGAVEMYAVALTASVLLLWIYGQLDGFHHSNIIAMTVVLGVPATLGASAGRLLLQ